MGKNTKYCEFIMKGGINLNLWNQRTPLKEGNI